MPRRRFAIGGIVQGVGFRPFVFRLAASLGLSGFVTNTSGGVLLEAEGEDDLLDAFALGLRNEAPPLARITSFAVERLPATGYRDFTIRESIAGPDRGVLIAPDVAVCGDCRRELLDPRDRRFRYPFINCVNCGPRYTIIRSVPYDRPFTSMAPFAMCPACQGEYDDPADRRFHAQPNACPACGPRLTLLSPGGKELATGEAALQQTIGLLRAGQIAAIKGIGGFHLAADPGSNEAVKLLRQRKRREEKPFALMVRDLATADALCETGADGARLLASVEAPIVLLPRRGDPSLALSPLVAPRSRWLGLMLPSAPLHVLLAAEFPALIMTSANLSDEPLCAGNAEALDRLADVADGFLVHDRDIVLRCDDSIVRPAPPQPAVVPLHCAPSPVATPPIVLRRARGFVPAPVALPGEGPAVLGLGAEMKGSVCVARGGQAFIGQHLGDLENEQAGEFLLEVTRHLLEILEARPLAVAHDLHPGYLTTRLATDAGFAVPWSRDLPVFAVQHHHAHVLSALAENGQAGPGSPPHIGLALDGTGFGPDGTVWGGEVLLVDGVAMTRLGRLRPLWMPGGEKAVREPYRMALSCLAQCGEGKRANELARKLFPGLPPERTDALLTMAAGRMHGIATSSAGRLFDAFSAALGVCELSRYEGQAAIELEMLTDLSAPDILPFAVAPGPGGLWEADLLPAFAEAVRLRLAGVGVPLIGGMFHRTLARALAEAACRCWEQAQESLPALPRCIALSGGVLQNEILSRLLKREFGARGFSLLVHRAVPANDGGISLGQAVYARLALQGKC